jgi:hypothetical protein
MQPPITFPNTSPQPTTVIPGPVRNEVGQVLVGGLHLCTYTHAHIDIYSNIDATLCALATMYLSDFAPHEWHAPPRFMLDISVRTRNRSSVCFDVGPNGCQPPLCRIEGSLTRDTSFSGPVVAHTSLDDNG